MFVLKLKLGSNQHYHQVVFQAINYYISYMVKIKKCCYCFKPHISSYFKLLTKSIMIQHSVALCVIIELYIRQNKYRKYKLKRCLKKECCNVVKGHHNKIACTKTNTLSAVRNMQNYKNLAQTFVFNFITILTFVVLSDIAYM